MSLLLYRLGGFIGRFRWLVIAGWFVLLLTVTVLTGLLGDRYNDDFSVPGTESQQGEDILQDRFGQTGTNGQIIFIAQSGKINDSAHKTVVSDLAEQVDKVRGVSMSDPLGSNSGGELSKTKNAVIGGVSFSSQNPSDETLDAVVQAAKPDPTSGVRTSVGGSAYSSLGATSGSRVGEVIGLAIAFGVLAITFTSFIAAGMPLLTAILGVVATVSGVALTSHITTMSSTSPTLAEMLGLAVGIDYSLFILSRHRGQLADGVPVVESIQRALSTAGSAVVFAGITVVIALCGLTIVDIPILTQIGLAAAGGVVLAVIGALTLMPSIAVLLGKRMTPRKRRRRDRRRPQPAGTSSADGTTAASGSAAPAPKGFAAHWVRLVTRIPLLTVVVVVVGLGVLALPLLNMRLALPDNSTAPPGSNARQTYNLINRYFGPGYNAPLSITADIITSTDPKKTVSDLATGLRGIKGVVAVPTSTPNQGGDTALIQVIPRGGQNAPGTADLVQRIRDDAPALEKKYKVTDLLVTGQTATNIDVSARLAGALLPFGAVVVGLSLILLMVVFRSIAVPIKATVGYLLSVGVALGAVVWVFQDGHVPGFVGDNIRTGPIVSFLPIFVMAVLFGLAMDYEMFLVSRMREAYVHSQDARQAIFSGFRASARVVTAAALIMTSVFAAFIPGGSSTVMPIAFGLAVGVPTDAFLVRMTLVPAILALLGRGAWWLPRRLARVVPVVDVEGEVLDRMLQHRRWQAAHPDGIIRLPRPGEQPAEIVVDRGHPVTIVVGGPQRAQVLAYALAGRAGHYPKDLVVDGLLLPEQQEEVRHRAAVIDLDVLALPPIDPNSRLVSAWSHVASPLPRGRRRFRGRFNDLYARLANALPSTDDSGIVLETALAIAGGASIIVYNTTADTAGRRAAPPLAARLGSLGITAVIVTDRIDRASAEWVTIIDLLPELPAALIPTTIRPASNPADVRERS